MDIHEDLVDKILTGNNSPTVFDVINVAIIFYFLFFIFFQNL